MHRHVQQAREIGERPAHAEGEHNDAHVLNRRVAEHPLDIMAAVEHEASEDERGKPIAAINGPGAMAPGLAASRSLNRSTA